MYTKLKNYIESNYSFPPELAKELKDFIKIRHLKKNEILLDVGQSSQHGYYLNKGSLIKTFFNPNGKEIVQGFFIDEEYAFISEIVSYLNRNASEFQIKAIEDCELIEFSKSQLDYLMNKYNEFAIIFHKTISNSYENLYMLSSMRLSLNAEEFLIYLYKNHPIYLRRIPDKYIAQFMGVSKEWFSKLKKKLVLEKRVVL